MSKPRQYKKGDKEGMKERQKARRTFSRPMPSKTILDKKSKEKNKRKKGADDAEI